VQAIGSDFMFLSGLVLIGLALAASYLSRVPDRSADGAA
jgi:hypothetical protein